jgi:pantoate ligase/cytidylate kinase
LDYVKVVHPQTLAPLPEVTETGLLAIAAQVGSTRLIDNIQLRLRKPIVAIDGPAGVGKSTVTRQIAQRLGLLYLDTGAMYRAVTWLALHLGITINDEQGIAHLVTQSQIQLLMGADSDSPTVVRINNHDVTQAIRGQEVTTRVSAIAAQPAVRQALVKQQQQFGVHGGLVAEGRDIGTYVFPDADLKIFLTASVQERARRRQQDLVQQGHAPMDLATLEQAIAERDAKDSQRLLAPLRPATDAIKVCTDGLTVTEVVDSIVKLYWQKVGIPQLQ